jgi:hypothetical protein
MLAADQFHDLVAVSVHAVGAFTVCGASAAVGTQNRVKTHA